MIVLGVLLLNLLQQPGRITFDTKLDLQFAPLELLSRSASLWNPDWALGGLQNQASGYLFPMGPAFALGELVSAPMWVWQRLWAAAVMLLAYEGARRLASHWPGIGALGAILAGLAYMLSPRVLTTVGGLSGETLPAAVLPWTVLPLVLYLQGRMRGWVAFVLSAATVPWMGGQNATLVVACLVLPGLLLLGAEGRSVRRRLTDLVAWGGMVLLASVWWLVPLLYLGSYAPPFLDYIESADNTSGAIGWLSSLRGTSHWVAFFPDGGRIGWVGGYDLASSRLLLLTTVLVAAAGLAGFLQQRLWQRRALVVSVVVGLAILTAGSGGWAGSVLSDAWLHALDTFLAPLRNIHKFDPVVRLPLSLGLGAWVTLGVPRSWRPQEGRALPLQRGVAALAAVIVGAAALPAVNGHLRTADGFADIPAAWRNAVRFLDSQPGPSRAMVLPGAGFAVQTWGRTIDEPIQVLEPPPWLARAQVTVAPSGTLRLLDSVESSVGDARAQQRLVEAWDRFGITHVIVRNDLAPDESDAPTPDLVAATMDGISGARVVASFGEQAGGRPSVVVYELDQEADPRVSLQDWEDRAVVSGGPEVVPDVLARGLATPDQAVVLAGSGVDADVVTDSNRRVERSFGRVHEATSGVMTREDGFRVDRLTHDYVASPPLPQTVAEYDGADQITASSSSGYADVLGPVRPEEHPYAAFDRSIYTAWATGRLTRPAGQWVEVQFDEPVPVGEVALAFDTFNGVGVTSVRIETEDRSVLATPAANGSVAGVDLADPSANRLRVTVLAAKSDVGQVRLNDVRIAGHDISRSLVLPGTVTRDTSVLVSSESPRRACLVQEDDSVTCQLSRQRETSETPGFDRTISISESGSWRLEGAAVATHGPAVEQLWRPLDDRLVDVVATSTYAGDPAAAPALALDGSPTTTWVSAPGDPAPALQLSWGPLRRITSVAATRSAGQPGRLPETLVVDAGPGSGEPQLVATTGPDAGRMRPVRTDQLRISALADSTLSGVGISELVVGGIEDLHYRPSLDTITGTVCGFGPTVEVAGQVVETRLSGTLRGVREGDELEVVPCGSEPLDLDTGIHRVRVTNPAGFAVTDLALVARGTPAGSDASAASAPVVSEWTPARRRVSVDVGPESVLGVSESFNRGWEAHVNGERLKAVELDGWRQGFVLPRGTSGVVTLVYQPQSGFRAALIVGSVLAVVLMLCAGALLLAGRYGRLAVPGVGTVAASDEGVRTSRRADRAVGGLAVLVLALVSVPLAAGAVLGWVTRSKSVHVVTGALAGALGFAALIALSGPGSVIVPSVGSDFVVAAVVGLVCGRAAGRP